RRREMVRLDGFRFASVARVAFDQSTSSTESCVAQYSRSSSSVSNFRRLAMCSIGLPLALGHVPRRNDTHQSSSNRENQEEQAPSGRLSQSVESLFRRGM